MKRTVATVAAATAALAALATVQAAAVAPAGPAGPVGPRVTCGTPGAPGYLLTRACVEVTGNQVRFYGVATATDPSWQAQSVGFTVSGAVVGSAPLAPVNPTVYIQSGGNAVGSVYGTAPCGATVTSTFSVNQPGWPASTATVSAVVAC
ncbi:hypothetical protein ACIRBX_23930 [Kitasatospora sp. NPDC096147]|uniref:hypothetical protein n=1 Tax=Kitasatospora sp. NPDC096147 TaxID=3364093 RepID=UPI0037FFB2AC